MISDSSTINRGITVAFDPIGKYTLQQACDKVYKDLGNVVGMQRFYVYDMLESTNPAFTNKLGVVVLQNYAGGWDVQSVSNEVCTRLKNKFS